MAINVSSNFDLSAQLPIRDGDVVADITARNAIPAIERYDGRQVYVVASATTYQLQGGILDANWVLVSTSGGSAPADATYLTLTTNAVLPNERVATGTTNQITITDNGAGSSAVFSTPQDIATASVVQFGRLGIGAAASGTNLLTFTQPVATTGSPSIALFTGGAHTTLTASTEATDIFFNLARTVQFSTGAIATQRAFRTVAPTYAAVAASVISSSITHSFAGAPNAGTNVTQTLSVGSLFGGDATNIGPTSAGMIYSNVLVSAHTLTVTGTTQVTGTPSFTNLRVSGAILTDASAVTVDSAATVYISGSWTTAGSVTITDNYAFWVGSGAARFGGRVLESQGANVASTNNITLGAGGNFFLITGTSSLNTLSSTGYIPGAEVVMYFDNTLNITHGSVGSGAPFALPGAVTLTVDAGDSASFRFDGTSWVLTATTA